MLDALNYILQRADEIAALENTAPLPVVVNLSYGTIAGPHDGTALLEAAIDQLIASRATPLRVVLPAGNHYLARCHARFRLPAAKPLSHPIEALQMAGAARRSVGELRRNLAAAFARRDNRCRQVDVRVTTPDGTTSPWIGPGGQLELAFGRQRALLHDLRRPVSAGQPPAHPAGDGADRCS